MRILSSRHAAPGLLVVMAIAAYANAFRGAFQFDDFAGILKDPHLQSLGTFLSHLDHTIRPLLKLTFFIDRRLYGENPAGYHLLNLALHVGSGLLVYRLLSHAGRRAPDGAAGRDLVPFWTAVLFLVHPVATEAVTYLSGRATGLMAFLYLAAAYLFVCATEPSSGPRGFWPRYLGALICFVLSLLAKEVAVTLPAALIVWDVVLRRHRGRALRSAFVRFHLPFWVILSVFLDFSWSHPRYAYLLRYSLALRPLSENLLTQLNTVAYALSLFVLPGRLNFDHDLPLYRSLLEWPTPWSLACLATLGTVALVSARRAPFVAFGLGWFFLHLMPTNSALPRYDLLSERNLYLPSIGLFLASASLVVGLTTRIGSWLEARSSPVLRIAALGRRALRAIAVLVPALLLLGTLNRNAVYRDPVAFWSDAVRKSPHKASSHTNLGYAYYLTGDLDRAIDEFRTALSLDRGYPPAQGNLRSVWALKSVRLDSTPE